MRLYLMTSKDFTTNQNWDKSHLYLVTSFVVITYLKLHLITTQVDNVTLQTGYFVQGGSSGTLGTVQTVNFTGPVASPYSTGRR